jgi:hypothetical protein
MNNFDTQPLLSEINTIVNNGFQEILKDYMKRHWLLEQTHDTLVNLPTVKEHYANKRGCDIDSCKEVKVKIEPGLEYVTKEETLKLIKNIDNKMIDFMKSNNELFNKLLIQMNELKNEIDGLKNENKNKNKNSVNFSHNEKENITLEIVDENVNENVDVESKIEELVIDQEVEEEEVEEVEEEEVEEEEEEEVEEEEEEVVSVETETKEPEEEEEEEELIEIEIDDVTYCTNNEENGIIYELDKEGNVGKRVGCLKEGDAYFD